MLEIIDNGKIKKWYIKSQFLRDFGIRSPMGFSFEFNNKENYFWTTSEFAARLFYKRHQIASEEVINNFKAQLEKEDYLYNLSYQVNSDKEFLAPESLQYKKHQLAAIEYCQLTGNVLIGDQMRTGKTVSAIGVINNSEIDGKILITCPKTAKSVWENHLRDWLITPRKVQSLTSQSLIDKDAEIYIVSYDNLHLFPELNSTIFGLIIADELHRAKNLLARRTKYFFKLQAKRKLGLTGTPAPNEIKDELTLLQWISPFWKDFYIYKDQYVSKSGITLSLEDAQKIARSMCLIRRLQDQVFDCEPIERRIIPLEAPPNLKDIIEKEWTGIQDIGTIRRQIGLAKVPYILNHADAYTSHGDKLVIFCYHREVVERLSASFGSKAVTLYGGVSDEARKHAVERFNTDAKCTIFLGSIGAASEAINLSVASHILFAEMDWANWAIEQADERCSDMNKPNGTLIEYLIFQNSLDEDLLNKRYFKDERADRAVDMIYG